MSEESVVGGDVVSTLKEPHELVKDVKPPKISEVDRLALELAKSQRQVSLAEAKTALANNEKAELQYKYVVLQIYMKYGLTEKDALNESGDILYNGANGSND